MTVAFVTTTAVLYNNNSAKVHKLYNIQRAVFVLLGNSMEKFPSHILQASLGRSPTLTCHPSAARAAQAHHDMTVSGATAIHTTKKQPKQNLAYSCHLFCTKKKNAVLQQRKKHDHITYHIISYQRRQYPSRF